MFRNGQECYPTTTVVNQYVHMKRIYLSPEPSACRAIAVYIEGFPMNQVYHLTFIVAGAATEYYPL